MPAKNVQVAYDAARLGSPLILYDVNGNIILRETAAKAIQVAAADGTLGFYGVTPIALQTGVAVSSAGIHAALVALNLITA